MLMTTVNTTTETYPKTHLLCAKAKAAALKQLTIPKLQTCFYFSKAYR